MSVGKSNVVSSLVPLLAKMNCPHDHAGYTIPTLAGYSVQTSTGYTLQTSAGYVLQTSAGYT